MCCVLIGAAKKHWRMNSETESQREKETEGQERRPRPPDTTPHQPAITYYDYVRSHGRGRLCQVLMGVFIISSELLLILWSRRFSMNSSWSGFTSRYDKPFPRSTSSTLVTNSGNFDRHNLLSRDPAGSRTMST